MSAPYIPHLTKPSGKDTVFLTLCGSRSSIAGRFLRHGSHRCGTRGRFFSRWIAADLRSRHRPAIHLQRHAQRDSSHGSRGSVHLSAGHGASCAIFPSRICPPAAPSTATTTICSPQRNRTPRRPAFATTAASEPTPRSPAAAADRRRRKTRRVAESGPAPEHQFQLQLVPLGLGPGESDSGAGRQERIEFLLAAGRLHGGLSPLHQHLNVNWNRSNSHTTTSLPTPPTIPRRPPASRCPTTFRSTTACPISRSAMAFRA